MPNNGFRPVSLRTFPRSRRLVWFGLVWFGGLFFERESRSPTKGPKEGAALRKPLLLTTLFGTRRNIPRIPDPILGPHVRLSAG